MGHEVIPGGPGKAQPGIERDEGGVVGRAAAGRRSIGRHACADRKQHPQHGPMRHIRKDRAPAADPVGERDDADAGGDKDWGRGVTEAQSNRFRQDDRRRREQHGYRPGDGEHRGAMSG